MNYKYNSTQMKERNVKSSILFLILILVTLVAASSCSSNKTSRPAEEVQPVIIVDEQPESEIPSKGWKKSYEDHLRKEISEKGKALIKYSNDVDCWISFFYALAEGESNHNPFETYREPLSNDLVTKGPSISQGLLQVSYQDLKLHNCPFSWEQDKDKKLTDKTKTIFDPFKNLTCGVILINKKVLKYGTPIRSSGRYYFSVLEPKKKGKWGIKKTNSRHQDFLKSFNSRGGGKCL